MLATVAALQLLVLAQVSGPPKLVTPEEAPPHAAVEPGATPAPPPDGSAADAAPPPAADAPPAEAPPLPSRRPAPAAERPRHASLLGAEPLRGASAALAWAGWSSLGAAYAIGFSAEDDVGAFLDYDWAKSETRIGLFYRRPLAKAGPFDMAGRLAASWYVNFGSDYVYDENHSDRGIEVAPALVLSRHGGGRAVLDHRRGADDGHDEVPRRLPLLAPPVRRVRGAALPAGHGRRTGRRRVPRRRGGRAAAGGARRAAVPRASPATSSCSASPASPARRAGDDRRAATGTDASGPVAGRAAAGASQAPSTPWSTRSISSASTAAVTRSGTSRPRASMKTTVGIPTMPYFSLSAWNAGVSSVPSTFTATKRAASSCTRGSDQAVWSSSLQATHQSAQKSMMTGRPSAFASDERRRLVVKPGEPLRRAAPLARARRAGGVDDPAHEERHAGPLRGAAQRGPRRSRRAGRRAARPRPAAAAAASAAPRAPRRAAASAGSASFRNTSAAARSATPNTDFTVSIHGPLFGSEIENAPMRKKRSPIPSA